MKPIVGLTSQYNDLISRKRIDIKSTYVQAVIAAGAIPVIIPVLQDSALVERYFDVIDGLILTGGSDISPLAYGENPLEEVKMICNHRDNTELNLFKAAVEKSIPVLGICRGFQLINIALGGTLYQDIPSQVPDAHGHFSLETMRDGYHEIRLLKGGYLYDIFQQDEIIVNSLHHQGIKTLGDGLKVSAKAKDGMIEAIESVDNKVYAVQFHPEDLLVNHKEYLKIFDFFIEQL